MSRLPTVTGRDVVRALEAAGFRVIRRKGSHVRLKHPDGRVTTVPGHAGSDIGRGLLGKILRDAEITRETFVELL